MREKDDSEGENNQNEEAKPSTPHLDPPLGLNSSHPPDLAPQHSLSSLPQLDSQPSMFETRVPQDLSWQHISMTIKKRKILHSVWGEVKHGETLAVMGPSGQFSSILILLICKKDLERYLLSWIIT